MSEIDVQSKIEARKRLMLSAKSAKMQGISRDAWENAQVIREFATKSALHNDIVEHIAAWVWTFRRK